MIYIQVQNWKKYVLVNKLHPLITHQSHTKHTVLDFFDVCSSISCLNYSGRESKKQFAVYDSDTPVTLKSGHRHQSWYEWLWACLPGSN